MPRLAALLLLFALSPAARAVTLTLDLGTALDSEPHATLVLAGAEFKARPLLGIDSYNAVNAGHWDGRLHASTIGVAKGLRLAAGPLFVKASVGASLISHTSERLSTAFEFYEQVAVGTALAARTEAAVFYRHWSNADIKQPNRGMDFAGLELAYSW